MRDATIRREMMNEINSSPSDRELLEAQCGRVWDTRELRKDFEVHCFLAPCVFVTRKKDGAEGIMMFQHRPRFYFNFTPKEV